MSQPQQLGYSRTPTPLPPTPRTVRFRGGGFAKLATGCGRVFILPHMLAGVFLFFYLIFLLLWAAFGVDYQGEVTGAGESRSNKSTTYRVNYKFPVDGVVMNDSQTVAYEVMNRYQKLDAMSPEQKSVRVRYLVIGVFKQAGLPELESPWKTIGGMTLFVLFWNGLLSVFVYLLWISPIRIRRLYVHGEPAVGRVLSKRAQSGKGTTYWVEYEFSDPVTGDKLKKEIVTVREAWNKVSQGDEVTVLFKPSKPKHSVAYELGPYQLADG